MSTTPLLDWKNTLYNGLATDLGRTPPVYSGYITKPNIEYQLSEIIAPELNILNDHHITHGLTRNSKQNFQFIVQ